MRAVLNKGNKLVNFYKFIRFNHSTANNHTNCSHKPAPFVPTKDYLDLLKGNREWVEEKTNVDKDYFIRRAQIQKPKYMIIGCADSRVPPNEMTKTEPGEIFIHRNVFLVGVFQQDMI